jgi:hypothetical protein
MIDVAFDEEDDDIFDKCDAIIDKEPTLLWKGDKGGEVRVIADLML